MDERYNIVIVPLSEEDGDGYAGLVPDLPGCISDGETRVEAITNTEDAIKEWIATQKGRGLSVPKPGNFAEIINKRNHEIAAKLENILTNLGSRVEALEGEVSYIREMIENLERRQSFESIVSFKGAEEDTRFIPAFFC